jgi:hypothetical protein
MKLGDVVLEPHVVRGREVEVLAIFSWQHHVLVVDSTREQRHALILCRGAVQGEIVKDTKSSVSIS